jgi:hypothetical protein
VFVNSRYLAEIGVTLKMVLKNRREAMKGGDDKAFRIIGWI